MSGDLGLVTPRAEALLLGTPYKNRTGEFRVIFLYGLGHFITQNIIRIRGSLVCAETKPKDDRHCG